MEVIEKTSTRLKLHYKTPRPFLFCLLGSLFISVGTIAIFVFAKKITLECKKTPSNTSNCQIITTGFINKIEPIVTEQELKKAEIAEIKDADTDRSIILVTEKEEIPISSEFRFGSEERQEKRQQINDFIQSSEQTRLIISQDDRIFSSLIGAGFILLGIGVITTALKQESLEVFYSFDRATKQLEITSKNLANKSSVSKLDFQEIEKVIVRSEYKGYRNDRADLYNLELVLVEGENYPIYTFIGNDMKAIADRFAAEINEFLK